MGDERTYENVVALERLKVRWNDCRLGRFTYEFLRKFLIIINKVKGINRVVYDISSKPPATIEWE